MISVTKPKLAGVEGLATTAPVTGLGPRFQRPLRFDMRDGAGVGLAGDGPGGGWSEFIRN